MNKAQQVQWIEDKEHLKALSAVYTERNRVVAAFARMAMACRWPACIGQDEDGGEGWRNVILIQTPTGQVSWHVHESEIHLFDFLPRNEEVKWDGHTTDEKYASLEQLNKLPNYRICARL